MMINRDAEMTGRTFDEYTHDNNHFNKLYLKSNKRSEILLYMRYLMISDITIENNIIKKNRVHKNRTNLVAWTATVSLMWHDLYM